MRLSGVLSVAVLAWPLQIPAGEPGPGSAEQAKVAVERHVQRKVSEGGGVYRLLDDRTGKTVELEFLQISVVSAAELWPIHDPARGGGRHGYAACTRFHPVGTPAEHVYDVDMSVEPHDGELQVTEVRIHKETRLVDGRWVWAERPAGSPAH